MAHAGLIQEVLSGQQAYKQDLIASFSHVHGVVDLQEIRQRLADEGVVSTTPLVTIPYTVESLEHASGLRNKHLWSDPFVTGFIDKALSARKDRDAGATAAEVNFARGFWSVVLDVAIVFDDVDMNIKDFGSTYAISRAIGTDAHEIAHSAFASISPKTYKAVGKNHVEVVDLFAIGQAAETTTLEPYSGSVPAYEPIWIDEAFGQYIAAEIRQQMLPNSIPAKARAFTFEEYEAGEIEIPPKYLIFSEAFPDYPGTLASVEGVGMDILTSKYPSLLPQIKSLTTGKLAIGDFHKNLRNDIGSELYSNITQRKPYTAWGNILKQVIEL
jgi:hypothetical protein